MSCVPCKDEVEAGCIPRGEFDRWTTSLTHVLESKAGRSCFREFLSSRCLEESEYALEYWERCEALLRADPGRDGQYGSHKSANITRLRFMKDVQDLVSFAEDKVDFDLAHLRCMYHTLESGKVDQIKQMLQETMQTAAESLQCDYQLFRKHLLQKRGLEKPKPDH